MDNKVHMLHYSDRAKLRCTLQAVLSFWFKAHGETGKIEDI